MRRSILCVGLLFFCLVCSVAMANNQNPNLNWGATDMMDAMMPPQPGFIFNNKVVMYSASKFVDGSGSSLPGTNKLSLLAYIPQAIWIPKAQPLPGGMKWGLQALWPIVTLNASSDIGLTAGNGMLGDPCFGPFVGGVIPFSKDWVLHWMGEFDTYAPVGSYDKQAAINPSANFWTFEPFLALTLQMPYGFMFDTRQHITFNTKNRDYVNPAITRDYADHSLQAGDLWHFNWALTKSLDFISPMLRFGAVGYYGQQLNNDQVDGNTVPDSKYQVFAIGPVIQYINKGTILSFKAYQETMVRNGTQGARFVFRVAIPF